MELSTIVAKCALVRSRIPGVDFVINPYLGCSHACRYCYAVFMRKYARHHRDWPWGSFVEVKENIAQLLQGELRRRRRPRIAHLASVCDPYQPVEKSWRLTRQCLMTLKNFGWQVNILTKSPLVLRDLDILEGWPGVSVGFSVTTDDEQVRRVLEPQAPSILSRVTALRQLKTAGINTWAFIGPMLPMHARRLYDMLSPWVDTVLVDDLHFREQVRQLYRHHGWDFALTDAYAQQTAGKLLALFGKKAKRV